MNRYYFKKSARILKRTEFVKLSKNGQKLKNEHFIAAVGPGGSETTRLGITVTKKIGCAVIRNRIKRFIREYFRLNRHNLKGPWDINIIAKKQAAQLGSDRIFASLNDLFQRIHKLHAH